MQPLQVRVDLGTVIMKEYSTFPKAPASDCLESYSEHSLGVSYPSEEGVCSWCILQPQPTRPLYFDDVLVRMTIYIYIYIYIYICQWSDINELLIGQ